MGNSYKVALKITIGFLGLRAVGEGIYLLELRERFSCNSYLVCSGKKKVLVDPGNSTLDELESQLRQAS
ncbi:MBL fold metallo-hydrolase, partial [Candidatus Micrarchaeota archaeon]|nr:MBL fold metallo-hydrolase [Candidatus Micrarchaeota archaeon]